LQKIVTDRTLGGLGNSKQKLSRKKPVKMQFHSKNVHTFTPVGPKLKLKISKRLVLKSYKNNSVSD